MRTRLSLAISVWALSLSATSRGDNWPQFRGPQGAGISIETRLPAGWSATQNLAWSATIPGYGWSSPIVWGDQVFVTTAISDQQPKPAGGSGLMMGRKPDAVFKWEVHCLSATDGKTLWKQTAAEKKPAIATNPTNGYATETPATDGERVYVYFGGIGLLIAYDFAGKEVWKADIGAYPVQFGHGTGTSPVLAGGRLFLQCDNEVKSFLAAFDAKTGKELWRVMRPERTSWSTPLVWENKARTEIICVGSPRVRSYDPGTGKQLWEMGGVTGQVKASPAASAELLYVGSGGGFDGSGPWFGLGSQKKGSPSGGGRPLFAIKAGAVGDLTLKDGAKSSDAVAWSLPSAGPQTASPLLYEGYLYILEERGGLVTCYNAETGEKVYKERVPKAQGFTSSPWACGGKVYCLDDRGTTHVLKAGPQFGVLGTSTVDGMCWSSTAIAGGGILVRTVDRLYCFKELSSGK